MSLISAAGSYSGLPLVVSVSGNYVSTNFSISGSTITATISGAPVKVSGEAVRVSGQSMRITSAATVITAAQLTVTGASGGTAFGTNTVFRATVRYNPQQSGLMWLGSTTNPPVSGTGLVLSTGDSYTADVANTNLFMIIASISGEKASYIGTAY